jgi:predicted acylesterase/phospholipase RssA
MTKTTKPHPRQGHSKAGKSNKPLIGLALGSGSARGWSHIGVLRTLNEAGIEPDIVCGSSIGALVGAAYVDGDLDRLEEWTRSLTMQTVVSFLDFSLGSGLIKGEKLIEFFRSHFVDRDITELPLPFGAVATDLQSGREIWLREGPVSDAVRASIALPGLFTPYHYQEKWLVDGGLVNPVPVFPVPRDGCRLGHRGRHEFRPDRPPPQSQTGSEAEKVWHRGTRNPYRDGHGAHSVRHVATRPQHRQQQ